MPNVRRFEPECVTLNPEFGAKELTVFDAVPANDNDGGNEAHVSPRRARSMVKPALAFASALAVALVVAGASHVFGVV